MDRDSWDALFCLGMTAPAVWEVKSLATAVGLAHAPLLCTKASLSMNSGAVK